MIVYRTLDELQKDIKDNRLVANGDIEICFDLTELELSIRAWNIKAQDLAVKSIESYNIDAEDIKAKSIDAIHIDAIDVDVERLCAQDMHVEFVKAKSIDAHNLCVWDVEAQEIDAIDIQAQKVKAKNIRALNIVVTSIDAKSVSYDAYCIAYEALSCESIKGRRENSVHRCLDSEIVIKNQGETV